MKMPTNRKLITFALVGSTSGFLSTNFIPHLGALYYFPGFMFGFFMSLLFFEQNKIFIVRLIFSTALSTLACYISVMTLFMMPETKQPLPLAMMLAGVAGLVGAIILSGFVWIHKLQQRSFVLKLLLCSGFIFASLFPFYFPGGQLKGWGLVAFHVLWQAGAAIALSFGTTAVVRGLTYPLL